MTDTSRLENFSPEIQESLKLFVVLTRASRAIMDAAQQDIKRYGLNSSEFAVLELLYHKGATPIQQIGGKILLASGTMTYVVDKLVNKQLIARVSCQKDRRVIYAELTAEGEELMQRIFPQHAEALHEAMSNLAAEDRAELTRMLKQLGRSESTSL
ncbi:MarR family winged helix-turn-helix transcriptional regulator [Paenibacillus sp. 481]|uniref:MarR family winged helix-turn-helix transcriptional regulator n=1 Tax=Paenibacillus sp. 481 TaxID=2835869 RepID=UPI001E2A6FC1|nr:MarR family transcriptional regulator [Paenibacillus sp. 481]UHA75036.1 MarR family transcriptional regulator [Paenibacillus sp. 481]